MFTMFQIFTGDGWSDIMRTLCRDSHSIDLDVAMFFVSYIFIAGIVLFNVVVAVLLDEFIKFIGEEKAREEAARDAIRQKGRLSGCLDPLTKTLVLFEDEDDLRRKIHKIFIHLDNDDSGDVCYEELCHGLRYMTLTDPDSLEVTYGIHVTYDDFEILTENGELLGSNGDFNQEQFTQMMIGELKRFAQRHLTNSVVLSSSREFLPTVMMNKMSALTNMHSIVQVQDDCKQMQKALAALNLEMSAVKQTLELEMTQLHEALSTVTSLLQKMNARSQNALQDWSSESTERLTHRKKKKGQQKRGQEIERVDGSSLLAVEPPCSFHEVSPGRGRRESKQSVVDRRAAPVSAHVPSVLEDKAQDVEVSAKPAEVKDCRHLATPVDAKGEQSVPVGLDQEIYEGLHNFFHTVHRNIHDLKDDVKDQMVSPSLTKVFNCKKLT